MNATVLNVPTQSAGPYSVNHHWFWLASCFIAFQPSRMHAAVVSSLSLEQYMELFHSLTKGTGTTVQHTTALEKNQYTTSALKEVDAAAQPHFFC